MIKWFKKETVSPDDGSEVDVFLVRVDAELELVAAPRLHDDWITSVQLRNVQVVAVFLVLRISKCL